MNYSFLTHQGFTLPYLTFGTGPELMFAFHGFARSAADFQAFESLLGKKYTIVAFDLFYHGSHALSLDAHLPAFELAVMESIIEDYLSAHKRETFSLMGYSFGGKIVLGIVQQMSHRITEVFLLAPDGFKKNAFYFILSNTMIGNWMLRGIVRNPDPVFKLNNIMLKSKLIHEKVHEFISDKLVEERYRKLVYRTWLTFRYYQPSLSKVANLINKQNIRFKMFFGKNDFIIPVSLGFRFLKKLKDKDSIIILESGHRLLGKADEIARNILEK